MPTININSIDPNTTVCVNGIVSFSRVVSILDGEELKAEDARRMSNGLPAIGKPHTSISISQASIVYDDPNNPSVAEKFVAERFYTSKTHPEKGLCYTAYNKSKNLPEIFCLNDLVSKTIKRVNIDNEIASGVNVTLVLRFFATKLNNGLSLDAVIVNDTAIKYAARPNNTERTLEAKGFKVLSDSPGDVSAAQAQLNAAPTPESPVPASYAQAPAAASYVQSTTYTEPPAAAVAPASVPASAPTSSLPIPPVGYGYDNTGKLVRISNEPVPASTGGIQL